MTIEDAKIELTRVEAQLLSMSQTVPKTPAEFNALKFEFDKLDLKRSILLKALEGKS